MLIPKDPALRDRKWLDELRNRPCVILGHGSPVRVGAHVRWRGNGGIALKPSDDRAVPLDSGLHVRQHNMGEVDFWREHLPQNPAFKRACWAALQRTGNIPKDAHPDELMMLAILAWASQEYRIWKQHGAMP